MRYSLLFFVCCFLCGCDSSGRKTNNQSRSLQLNIAMEPQSLDPRKARDVCSLFLMRMLFDGLTRENVDGKIELALAEHFDVAEDMCTYTFKLRPTRWSNGDMVTAEDFIYAWKKTLSPSFPTDNAFHLYVIKNGERIKKGEVSSDEIGARAIDHETLAVELERPTSYFLELLTMPVFFPIPQRVESSNLKWPHEVSSYVSNGPFILKTWKHEDQIVIQKNPKYWDVKSVNLPEIRMIMVREDTELYLFQNGELDWVGSPLSNLPLDALPSLRKQENVLIKPFLGTCFLRVNTLKFPLNQSALRRALSIAINRKNLVDHVTLGNQIPAMGLVPEALGLKPGEYFSDGNVSEARALFHQALKTLGVKKNQFPPLRLLYKNEERNYRLAQAIQQQWYEAFGIEVQLEPAERKVYFDRLGRLDYDIAAGSWFADFSDPLSFLNLFKQTVFSSNNTGWENAEYTNLLENASVIENRAVTLRRCEEILMREMPIIPIFQYSMVFQHHKGLKNVVLSQLGNLDFKWAYFEGDTE